MILAFFPERLENHIKPATTVRLLAKNQIGDLQNKKQECCLLEIFHKEGPYLITSSASSDLESILLNRYSIKIFQYMLNNMTGKNNL
jgi:hypothetical protein